MERRRQRAIVIISSLLETTQKTTKCLGEFSRSLRQHVKFLDSQDPPPLKGTTSDETFARDLCSIENDDIVPAFIQSLLCGRFSAQERLNSNDVEGTLACFNANIPLKGLDKLPAAFEIWYSEEKMPCHGAWLCRCSSCRNNGFRPGLCSFWVQCTSYLTPHS
jgi:hypothetical protein